MLKQRPNRNQRTKGFKVKQGFKTFILIALGIWLIYQLKHSHDKNKAYEENSGEVFEKLKAGHETKKLGRKRLEPWIKKLIDDTEDSKSERVKEQSSGGGGGDVVGQDQDRVGEEEPEEVEDLIDEEDKEKEDEDGDDMRKEIEDENLLEDQGHNEGEKETHATSEKHYKENSASRVAMRGTQYLDLNLEVYRKKG